MNTPMTPRALALCTIAVAALAGALLAQDNIQAQEEETAAQAQEQTDIVVGTYEPQQVAERYGINQKLMEGLTGLQERMQTAQQQGDQQAMQEIQAEAQQVQEDVVSEFEKEVEDAMAAVAEETGADIIAVQVAYLAEGIETKDVTNELIEEMDLEPAPGAEIGAEETRPAPQEQQEPIEQQ